MPYITNWRRVNVDQFGATEAGELNFAISSLLKGYFERKGLSYATINDCLGALEGAKLEFVRRVVNPYEDGAIKRNGDLF